MAILDARLLPLIDVLVAEDADWLAFELLGGVQLGKVVEETPDDLRRACEAAGLAGGRAAHSEKHVLPPPASAPIVGDDQIAWAANYVSKRITDVLMMLQAAIDQMETILSGAAIHDQSLVAPAENGITLILRTDDEDLSVSKSEVAASMNAISSLQEALLLWSTSARDGGVDE